MCLQNGSSRSHRALEATPQPSSFYPFVIFCVAPLWPLGLGILGRGGPRSCTSLFVRRYGRRSGQPSSLPLAGRACVHVWPYSSPGLAVYGYKFSSSRKRPWSLRRPGEMTMATPPCRSFPAQYIRHFPFAPCRVTETSLLARTQGRTLDCIFYLPPPRVAGWLLMCRCQVCNKTAVASVATGPRQVAL